jgi:hypothetical protein
VVVGFFGLGVGATIFAANCVCVYYMPRYSLPLLTTAVFALLTSMTTFVEGRLNQIETLIRLWEIFPGEYKYNHPKRSSPVT